MKRVSFLLVFVCLTLTTLRGQVMPLDSVLSKIERNNPALLSYANRINASNELVNSANAWNPPSVGVKIGDNPYSFDLKNNSYNAMLFAEQWIPNQKQINAKQDYLRSFSPIRQQEYEYMKNQYFAHAKEKYFERYVTELKIKVLKENIDLMNSMIEISEKQISTGMGTLGSIYKMKARLANAQTMLVHEENMVKTLTAYLNYLMYRDAEAEFSLDTNNLVRDYRNVSLLAVKDSLERKRSDIQRLNNEITNMKLNQSLTSSQLRPTYGFRYEHTTTFGDRGFYAAMFQVSLPIVPWSSRGYNSQVKAMGFDILALEQNKQALLNEVNQKVNAIILELKAEYTEVDNYLHKIIPAYRKSFETTLIAYGQNTGQMMETILAWDDLQMAQMTYLTHLGVLLKAQAEYEKELQIR